MTAGFGAWFTVVFPRIKDIRFLTSTKKMDSFLEDRRHKTGEKEIY
jgi:hypothetical protein